MNIETTKNSQHKLDHNSAPNKPGKFRLYWQRLRVSKFLALTLAILQLQCLYSFPVIAEQTTPSPQPHLAASSQASASKSNLATKKNTIPRFDPMDAEIIYSDVFVELLIPTERLVDKQENKKLMAALQSYKRREVADDISSLEEFLRAHPRSRWAASLEFNIGMQQMHNGRLTQAVHYLHSSWERTKNDPAAIDLANGAISHLLILKGRLGKVAEMTEDLKEIEGRSFFGSDETRIQGVKEGLSYMKYHEEMTFKCGPYALNTLLGIKNKNRETCQNVVNFKASKDGTNLAQLKELARKNSLDAEVVFRSEQAPIPVPSIMHLKTGKTGHFAAIVGTHEGRYVIEDHTFDKMFRFFMTEDAINRETDGYFLVLTDKIDTKWKIISEEQAAKIWGGTKNHQRDQNSKSPGLPNISPAPACPSGGLATASAWAMQSTLNIVDVPLSYDMPFGPPMEFKANYNHQEADQPTTFDFANLGPDWNFNWTAYVQKIDPTSWQGNVSIFVRGGGSEYYANTGTIQAPTYDRHLLSQAKLEYMGTWFKRTLPDGSVEEYAATGTGGKLFLSIVRDPQNNIVVQMMGPNGRPTHIRDGLGRDSAITYRSTSATDLPAYYRIQNITDPFGRTCTFSYDATNTRLLSITDSINLTSSFTYEPTSSFITSMTTPYGTTSFEKYLANETGLPDSDKPTGLRFIYPDGSRAVMENWIIYDDMTVYWDRHAMSQYPNDPANKIHPAKGARVSPNPGPYHCTTYHWQYHGFFAPAGQAAEAPVLTWIWPPHDYKTKFFYEGSTLNQTSGLYSTGVSNKPIRIEKGPDSPPSAIQVWEFTRNSYGNITSAKDPLNRNFTFTYSADGIDLLQVKETTTNQIIAKWVYGLTQHPHRPTEFQDSSGQKTTFTYHTTRDQLLTVTDPNNKVTTFTYNTNGFLTSINGAMPLNNDITTLTYDSVGRIATLQDSAGYTRTFSYDNADRLTQTSYPDGTSTKIIYDRLDAVLVKDTLGRWSQRSFDALNQLVSSIDPLGQKTRYEWCSCGALKNLFDANGNKTSWNHDLQGRITKKTHADGKAINFAYDQYGRLSSRADNVTPNPPTTTYSYNMDNTLSAITYTNQANPTPNIAITYDRKFPRIVSLTKDGSENIRYTYKKAIIDPTAAAITGGGRLQSITMCPLATTISYEYDALGRISNRAINGSDNSTNWTYDEISRVKTETNDLGTFTFAYIDDVLNQSKGDRRLSSITYPNGQSSLFTWLPNQMDKRLHQIKNVNASSVMISQFNYGYNELGQITQWQQQQNAGNAHHDFEYDKTWQLKTAQIDSGSTFTLYIGGTAKATDVISVTGYDASIITNPIGQRTASASGSSLSDVAINLASNIQSTMGTLLGLTATPSGQKITIQTAATKATSFSVSVSGSSPTTTIAISQSVGKPPFQKQLYYDYDCVGNRTGVQGDSSGSFPTGLMTNATKATFNCLNQLTSTAAGGAVRFKATTVNPIKGASANFQQTATVNTGLQNGDVLIVAVHDRTLPMAQHISYTVQTGDTPTMIATALTSAINGNQTLQNLGVTATSASATITVTSSSLNPTEYTAYLNGSPSATAITFGARCPEAATLDSSKSLTANPKLAVDSNTTALTAASGGGTKTTNTYPVTVNSVSGASFSYDYHGNLTFDGTNTYNWDGEDRLISIVYPGTNNKTEMTYDVFGRRSKIVEKTNNVVTSTKQFVWCGTEICEERDANGNVTKKYFGLGRTSESVNPATKFFYFRDHLGSVREVTNSAIAVQAQYSYDPFGVKTNVITENASSDFGFAGMYDYVRPDQNLRLNFTLFRAYSPTLGRWLTRDPLSEVAGTNLYSYTENNPISRFDPLGQDWLGGFAGATIGGITGFFSGATAGAGLGIAAGAATGGITLPVTTGGGALGGGIIGAGVGGSAGGIIGSNVNLGGIIGQGIQNGINSAQEMIGNVLHSETVELPTPEELEDMTADEVRQLMDSLGCESIPSREKKTEKTGETGTRHYLPGTGRSKGVRVMDGNATNPSIMDALHLGPRAIIFGGKGGPISVPLRR